MSLCKYSKQSVAIKSKDFLFRQGEMARGCYLIKSGTLRLFMESPTGKRITERVVGIGCIVGLPATINGKALSLSCRVVDDAELVFLTRRELTEMMKDDINAAMKLLDLLSSEVQSTRKQVAKYLRPVNRKALQKQKEEVRDGEPDLTEDGQGGNTN
jgi:CRP-like cAMP-binding protein